MKSILHHPAHLWISDPQTLEQEAIQELQKIICKNGGCLTCSSCTTIAEKTHPWTNWIEPENNYTTDVVDTVIKNSTLQLDDTEFRFFILTKADRLNAHCANRLLKTIEEPHKNYFFIFFSQNKDIILPTIQSRCLLKEFTSTHQDHLQKAIIEPLMHLTFDKPGDFFKLLTTSQIKEQESQELLHALFAWWTTKHKQAVRDRKNTDQTKEIISVITKHLEQPIMPGSSKIVWKNMYLSLHHIACSK